MTTTRSTFSPSAASARALSARRISAEICDGVKVRLPIAKRTTGPREIGEAVAMAVLGGDLVAAKPHVALDRAHHGARLTALETDGVDAAVAFNREMRLHRDRSLAHEDLALGRYRDHRRQQRVAGLEVGDDLRTLALP